MLLCRKFHCDERIPSVRQVAARLNLPEAGDVALAEDVYGPFSGQVSSAARQALRRAVAEAHPLLVEAMLLCELSTTSDVLSGANRTRSLPLKEFRSWRGLERMHG